ncbi:hypothetical protein ACJX0J_033225, partial [Zea mays]
QTLREYYTALWSAFHIASGTGIEESRLGAWEKAVASSKTGASKVKSVMAGLQPEEDF